MSFTLRPDIQDAFWKGRIDGWYGGGEPGGVTPSNSPFWPYGINFPGMKGYHSSILGLGPNRRADGNLWYYKYYDWYFNVGGIFSGTELIYCVDPDGKYKVTPALVINYSDGVFSSYRLNPDFVKEINRQVRRFVLMGEEEAQFSPRGPLRVIHNGDWVHNGGMLVSHANGVYEGIQSLAFQDNPVFSLHYIMVINPSAVVDVVA